MIRCEKIFVNEINLSFYNDFSKEFLKNVNIYVLRVDLKIWRGFRVADRPLQKFLGN